MRLFMISGPCGSGKSTMKDALSEILNPTDEAIWERLRARPAERGFTSDDKIEPHVGYNQWFRRNKGKFPLVIDNTNQTIDETAGIIRKFIENYPKM